MHVLAQFRKREKNGKIRVAVAVVFTKSDEFLADSVHDEILQWAEPLLSVCKNAFSATKYFFVSAAGSLVTPPDERSYFQGVPKCPISPKNVLDPFDWAMETMIKRINRPR
jgi:hypothetical protein